MVSTTSSRSSAHAQLYTSLSLSLCAAVQRALIQRVLSASVTVDGQSISSIGRGLLVLVGIGRQDTQHDADWIGRKILNIRLWEVDGKPWTGSVASLGYELLLVSQFTLHAELKGNKPDFHQAMQPAAAKELYASFVRQVRQQYRADRVQDGEFGALMAVQLVNDGPVTLQLDTAGLSFDREKEKESRPFSKAKQGSPAATAGGAADSQSAADASSSSSSSSVTSFVSESPEQQDRG